MDYVAYHSAELMGQPLGSGPPVWNAQPETRFASAGQARLGHRESGQEEGLFSKTTLYGRRHLGNRRRLFSFPVFRQRRDQLYHRNEVKRSSLVFRVPQERCKLQHWRDDDDIFAPAGAVSSSIADMVPYLRMQLNGGRWPACASPEPRPSRDARRDHGDRRRRGRPHRLRPRLGDLDYLGRRVVQHGGDFSPGVSTMVSMVPEDGVGIVVLTNAFPEGHALATALTNTLYDLYLEGAQQDWLTTSRRC